ncbi:proteasome-interacting protein cic1 [Malassezia yamatoensis]|uniref:Ribosomal L1 domain-containing protein 1 n=1 Tax=Malassezia yamatoensis TaxID=253288 RepID=A0AAJ6CKC7_9BASI|nr:proteasome-interacting protein cic1 [Malassezia yamatoensis]
MPPSSASLKRKSAQESSRSGKPSKKDRPSKSTTEHAIKAGVKTLPPIAGKVDSSQVFKAFQALLAYTERKQVGKENELPLDGPGSGKDTDHTVWVQITIKQLNPERKVKPARISLAYPLLDESASVCLLTKDPQREYKDLLQEKKIHVVNRVVGVEKLKGKFRPFDARRALAQEHDLFLADERIVPLLPKLCGSVFYKNRKFPVPVDLTKKKRLPETIANAIASTYFLQNKGSCTSIKIGSLHRQTPEQLVENLTVALPQIISKMPGKWGNVQNIEVKTGSSAALPIWNCKLSEGEGDDVRWSSKDIIEHDQESDSESDDQDEE